MRSANSQAPGPFNFSKNEYLIRVFRLKRRLVVYSENAYQRAGKTLAKAQARECEKVNKQLFHLQARRFTVGRFRLSILEAIVFLPGGISLALHRLL